MDPSVFENPALTLALALAAGTFCQGIGHHLRIPGIVLLLGAGVVLGPDVLNVVRPQALGAALPALVGFAVAVVLFEGGMNLNWKRLKRQQSSIRRLVTWGALVTALGGALAAKIAMGWDWNLAVLFGALVIVTGPTVVTPLLRRIRVNTSTHTILEAEGILIDPIGALVAVVALEVVAHPAAGTVLHGILDLVVRLGLGAGMGLVGGLIIVWLLKPAQLIPEGLENIFILSMVFALYQVSDVIRPESGIATVTVAGLVVGNFQTRIGEELREFKEQITLLLIGMLFVLLSADVRFSEIQAVGVNGLFVVLALIFVVRPLNVLVGTAGLSMARKEQLFLAWMAPRGILAAAVASYFAVVLADMGIARGNELRALVFVVIAVTVTLYGLTGGIVAELLGVRRKKNMGYALLSAGPLGRALGNALRQQGEEVTLIDSNPDHVTAAQGDAFKIVFGNGLEERTHLRARFDAMAGCIGVTPNDELNYLFADRVQKHFKGRRTYMALHLNQGVVTEAMVSKAKARLLFGARRHVELWSLRAERGTATMETWIRDAEGSVSIYQDAQELSENEKAFLPLVWVRKGKAVPVDETVELSQGDSLVVLVFEEARGAAEETLGELGLRSGMISP